MLQSSNNLFVFISFYALKNGNGNASRTEINKIKLSAFTKLRFKLLVKGVVISNIYKLSGNWRSAVTVNAIDLVHV